MNASLTKALDHCLTLLKEEQVTLEICLARYPAHAQALRPLLEMAVELNQLPSPLARPTATARGKEMMLQALAEKQRAARSTRERLGYLDRIRRAFSQLQFPRTLAGPRQNLFRLAVISTTAMILLAFVVLSALRGSGDGDVAQTATLVQTSGLVEIAAPGDDYWNRVAAGIEINVGDQIRTGPSTTASLVFPNNSRLDLKADTLAKIVQMHVDPDDRQVISIYQTAGETRSQVQPLSGRFEIRTPSALATVHGTIFSVTVGANDATYVKVIEGEVDVASGDLDISRIVGPGEEVIVRLGQAPAFVESLPTPAPSPSKTPTPDVRPFPTDVVDVPLLHVTITATTTIDLTSTIVVSRPTTVPPELTQTAQPPTLPQPPDPPRTPHPPQPPGLTKTPQPPGQDYKPDPPGQDKKPPKRGP